MEVDINWLAVIAATISSMLIGSLWYSKTGFLKVWLKYTKMTEKQFEQGAKKAPPITIVTTFVTAFALAHFTYITNAFFDNSFLQDALMTSLWVWLGFTATRFAMHGKFEQKPERLTFLTLGFELVSILVMGFIIGIMQ